MPRKISLKNRSHEDWLLLRNGGIGGSDAAAAVGASRWKSSIRLYMEKTGQIEQKISPEAEERMHFGQVMEDVIAKEYKRRHNRYVRRSNYIWIDDKHDWMLADFDRIIAADYRGPGILECKNSSAFMADDWQNNNAPLEAYLQMQHYLAVSGYQWGVIAAVIGGNRYVECEVERDGEVIRGLIEKEAAFWQSVQDKNPPEFDGSNDAAELLKELFPEEIDNVIELPEKVDWLLSYVEIYTKGKKTLEKKIEKNKQQVKALMEENTRGISPCYDVFYLETKAGSRRFTFKRRKKEEEHEHKTEGKAVFQ